MTGSAGLSRRFAVAFVAVCGCLAPGVAAAETVVLNPGPEQTFVVPAGVTHIKVTAVGERGEDECFFGCFNGLAEQVSGSLTVTPGEKLYADFVGGGPGSGFGGRGGNASDLRTIANGQAGSLESRVIVAGGGGGEGEVEEGQSPGAGGKAGSSEGQAGNPASTGAQGGGGGTQGHGGTAGAGAEGQGSGTAGTLGQGGKGGSGSPSGSAGGGGGGYYGGGGGGAGQFAGAGGGGGSSFLISGAGEPSFVQASSETPPGITITYPGGTETVTYGTGSERTFVVPVGVAKINVIAVGGTGESEGGKGERVTASLAVKPGQTYYIDFGGAGGGFPGGGVGADVRTVSSSQPGTLASRLIVAGGGGGDSGFEEGNSPAQGGSAGFTIGGTGTGGVGGSGGGGGTQSGGGARGTGEANGKEGLLGQGGEGGGGENHGGGGGGGYYGGGGGGGGVGSGGGGGGGSSFVTSSATEVSSSLNGTNSQAGTVTIQYASAVPPTASITTPAEGARYTVGQSVIASYSCSEGSGGSGLKPGTEGCSGPVANGAAVDTSTAGEHKFTVTATSEDGLTGSKSVSYDVAAAPSVSITTPAENAQYAQGATVDAAYSCSEGAGGPGLKPGSEGCSGTVANGAPLDTSTPGKHELKVTATSQDGLATSKGATYTVIAPPSVSIVTPAEGSKFAQGEVVDASYSCSEGASGPGLKPGSEGCSGTVANGSAIDTSTPGKHEFTVSAHSKDGQSSTQTVEYTVSEPPPPPPSPPTVTITAPSEFVEYSEGQVVDAEYSCGEGAGGPGLKPGTEGCSGSVANGAPIDTSSPGEHGFTVAAHSKDGQSSEQTITYRVAAPPPPPFATITTPAEGAEYNQGEVVDAEYSCSESESGPGLKPGAEGCNGPVASGSAIDTSMPGQHEFTVTATSEDGQTGTATTKYTVIASSSSPPVFGRCIKLAKGSHGQFKNSTCTRSAGGAVGKFEWIPGPGPHPTFSVGGAPVVIETPAGHALQCTEASGEGSITGPKTVEFALRLTGCEDGGEPCTSAGTEGEVLLGRFTGTLGWSNRAKRKLALQMVPRNSPFGSYQCPDLAEAAKQVSLTSDGIPLGFTVFNRMEPAITGTFAEKQGEQVPGGLEGEPARIFEEHRLIGDVEETTTAGIAAKLVATYEERYEVNTLFSATVCSRPHAGQKAKPLC